MTHLSENVKRLEEKVITYLEPSTSENNVWFIDLPNIESTVDPIIILKLNKEINSFIDQLNQNSVICIHSSPFYAASFLCEMNSQAFLKLWIGIKLANPLKNDCGLSEHHSALIVVTKYKESLKHTLTRIGYTFCPICNKTTKDYGGKKHLYNSYGTLMSDVWRDISIDYNGSHDKIIDRLRDLFGLEPYSTLNSIDLRSQYTEVPKINSPKYPSLINNHGFQTSTIINGDCLEELRKIPSDSIDFCFADPPYNVKKQYETWNDNLDIIKYFEWCDEWLHELGRIIKPGKIVAILNIPQWVVRHFKFLKGELNFFDWILWEGLSLPVRMIMPAHYSILCFVKGEPLPLPGTIRNQHSIIEKQSLFPTKEFLCSRYSCVNKREKLRINDRDFTTNLWWDIHRLKHNSRRVDHPTQLPPLLMRRLIALFTNEGEFVLDPFNGSGTTSLCAQQLNRNYIGIEISQYYFDISRNRHNDLTAGIDPFRKTDDVPKAKNSYVKRLKKQKYQIDKKTLQLEIKRISQSLGHIPTREEVLLLSKYPINYFDDYFINWSEVTAAARTTGMAEVEDKNKYDEVIQGRLFDFET